MFRQTHRFWQFILRSSTSVVLAEYGITKGILVVDDFDKKRFTLGLLSITGLLEDYFTQCLLFLDFSI